MKWQQSKRFVWIAQVAVWLAILMLPFIFTTENDTPKGRDITQFRNLDHTTNFLWIALFYVNAIILIPRLFYKRKYLFYACSLLLAFIITIFLHGALFLVIVQNHHFNFIRSSKHNSIPFLFTIALSCACKIIYDRLKADAQAADLQRENLKTELSYLRSQISPHFLFNVLNNIVAMVRLKSEELEPTVIKLSSLLQYMLYESDDEKVLLKNEVDSLKDYVDLQKLRFSSNLNLQVSINVKEEWHSIEPMLLIPFVENAFKHGNGLPDNPEIIIDLHEADNKLDFIVKNKFVAGDDAKDKTSGIGLANVKRRLDLLYPKAHRLQIDDGNGWYNVHLNLYLK